MTPPDMTVMEQVVELTRLPRAWVFTLHALIFSLILFALLRAS